MRVLVHTAVGVVLLGLLTAASRPAGSAVTAGAGDGAGNTAASGTATATATSNGTPTSTPPPLADPFDSDAALPEHAEDVVDYTLRATLDPVAHTVHGEGTIRWRNTSDVPVRELWVHLYLNAFKSEKSVFLREDVGGRGSTLPKDWGQIDVRRFALRGEEGIVDLWPNAELHRPNDEDETDVRVPLPREVAAGETITIEVVWDDKLPSVVERTGYDGSFHLVGQWFPKIARLEPDGRWAHFPFHHLAEFYADFGTYDVTLDVPEAFILGGTGRVTESRIEGGRRIERRVQEDVHDFAWTAWDRWKVTTEEVAGVTVTMLYPPGFDYAAKRELATIRFALPYYGARYGRYPYSVLTVAHPPSSASEAGGMEYPTFITTGGPWYGPPGVFGLEYITVHEFGHQYFYGLVASDEVTWPFLDEGLNSYAEAEALDEWLGAGSLVALGGVRVSNAASKAVMSNAAVHDEIVAKPAFEFSSGNNYGRLVYSRTAAILETLRRVYGDANMARALGRYTRRYRFKHPTPDDLIAVFEEVLGPRASKAMRAAFFDRGWVDYAIDGISSKAASDGEHEGWVLVRRRGNLSFPVTVQLVLDDVSTQIVHWDGEAEFTRVPYRGGPALVAAVVDPDRAVIVDDDLTNNHATAMGATSFGAPFTFERAMYLGQLLVQAVSP